MRSRRRTPPSRREASRPNFMAVGGWDGMHVIYEVAKKLGGRIDGDKAWPRSRA